MNRKKAIILGVIVLGAIVGILWHNKAQMQAKSKANLATAFPVSVSAVAKQPLVESLSFVGTIAANNDVAIVSETQGRVVGIYAQIGDAKKAGSVLIHVDDELKKADFMKSEITYERAKKDAERFAALRQERAATEWQKDNAWQAFKIAEAQFIRARKEYRDTKIATPISGIVTSRTVDIGTMVQPGMVVANVVDISKLKVKLTVPEQDAFKLSVGDPVEVTTDVYPGVAFAGTVSAIGSKADAAHMYPVEISLPNSKKHPLKAGMFGRVNVKTRSAKDALAISKEWLLNEDTQPMVFVAENGVAKARPVRLGIRTADKVQILEGLAPGELVVSFGQRKLKDGSAIQYER